MSTTAVNNLLRSIEDEIDAFFSRDDQAEDDAVYFLEQLNSRIMTTIFSREEKVEFMAIAAGRFYAKGIARRQERVPKTFWDKVRFLFAKEHQWQSI